MISIEQWRCRIGGSCDMLYKIVQRKLNRRKWRHHSWVFAELIALIVIIGLLKICLENYENVRKKYF